MKWTALKNKTAFELCNFQSTNNHEGTIYE